MSNLFYLEKLCNNNTITIIKNNIIIPYRL